MSFKASGGAYKPVELTTAVPSAAPAGGTGTAAGGWDTAGNRDSAITTINSMRTVLAEVRATLVDVLRILRDQGIVE